MSNYFWRQPLNHGDNNQWGTYLLPQLTQNAGVNTAKLYNDSGTLKLTTGYIGISNGTYVGVALIDTTTTIDVSGVSSRNWAKIEMSVSGSTVTFTAADIDGAKTEGTIPAEFTDAYDGEKGAYYIASTKRCIGIAWKTTAGALSSHIINDHHFLEKLSVDELRIGTDAFSYNSDVGALVRYGSPLGIRIRSFTTDGEFATLLYTYLSYASVNDGVRHMTGLFEYTDAGATLHQIIVTTVFMDVSAVVIWGYDIATSTIVNALSISNSSTNVATGDLVLFL